MSYRPRPVVRYFPIRLPLSTSRVPTPDPLPKPGVEGSSPFVRSREAALPPGQIVGGHFPSTYVASDSPGQGGMETQMNVRSASPVFRY
jgi:hypothetical protein